jgi:hypothetical protein
LPDFKNFLQYNKKLLLTLQIKARNSYLTPILEDLYFDIRTHTKYASYTIPVEVSALFVLLQFTWFPICNTCFTHSLFILFLVAQEVSGDRVIQFWIQKEIVLWKKGNTYYKNKCWVQVTTDLNYPITELNYHILWLVPVAAHAVLELLMMGAKSTWNM